MSKSQELIIVKLGGSIITDKQRSRPTIRRKHALAIARIIKRFYSPKKHRLILIHGAGSFGHLHAHEHQLSMGTKNHPEKIFHAVENQSLDAKLNSELTQIFLQAGLPVVGMPTRSLASNSGGTLENVDLTSLLLAISNGTVPLLHGDMVFDKEWGLSILSGDILMAYLTHKLQIRQVFFASDVDGIFTDDPHVNHSAKFVPSLSLSNLHTVHLQISHNRDVTGGLSKKFSAFQVGSSLENIYFFNGRKPENFAFLFNQKNFHGTTIKND